MNTHGGAAPKKKLAGDAILAFGWVGVMNILALSMWREDMREEMAEWLDKTAPRR